MVARDPVRVVARLRHWNLPSHSARRRDHLGPDRYPAALATAGWTKALWTTAAFAAVQIVDQNALSPFIFGQRVKLSFLLIIFSTVLGGTLLGIAGAFLAVPAAAALQVIVIRIVAPAIRSANKA